MNETAMWWEEHWLELAAIVAFVGSWADLRARVSRLAKEVEAQNGRIGKNELDYAELRGQWAGVMQEREAQERRRGGGG